MASTYFLCPKGHDSTDSDFCSECGSKIQGNPGSPQKANANGSACPDCGAPVPAGGINFCEICGYNFVTRTSGQFPVAKVVEPPPPPPVTAPAPAPAPVAATGFKVVVTVDASLKTEASPDAPASVASATYALDKPVSLIGRKSEAKAIFPEIPLDFDSAVSHRHALITLGTDGSLTFRDLGSSNGTRLNGTDVAPLSDVALKAGDQLTLGHWTRISVEAGS